MDNAKRKPSDEHIDTRAKAGEPPFTRRTATIFTLR